MSRTGASLLLLCTCLLLAVAQTPGEENPCGGCVHGVCSQDENTSQYTCQCLTGYTGLACNTTAASAPAPGTAAAPAPGTSAVVGNSSACVPTCAHSGLCQLLGNGSSVCNCDGTGYSGPTCSLSGTTASSPFGSSREPGCAGCAHGATCVQATNSQLYHCECSGTGYTGVNCTVPVGQAAVPGTPPPPPTAASVTQENNKAGAVVPTGLGAGAVAGIILAIAVAGGIVVGAVVLWRMPRKNSTRFERYTSDMEIPSSNSSKSPL